MTALFISYRRSDSKSQSVRLYDRLVGEFGRDNVFFDIDSMPIGTDFPTVLDDVLGRCRAVLVVIGPEWLTAIDAADGTRRLYNPRDFVRLEVEAALQRDVLVVPVLVGGATLPDPRKLPESLRPLCLRHAVEVGEGPRSDGDTERLVGKLKRELSGAGPEEPLPKTPERPADEHAAELVGRDRAFPLLAEQAVTGSNLIVLAGPAGAGKTVTAVEFARWYVPPARHGHILMIDARQEFYELSLIEAVGKAYPEEFYGDHDGVPVTALPLRNLRHLAVELLARHEATVILDGPGEAAYPRDGTTELNLARRTAVELAGKAVLVLVTTRNETCWADHNPIPLQGLSPDNALTLLRRELLRWDPSARPEQLEARLGGASALADLLERGSPGELIAAGRRAGGQPGVPAGRQGARKTAAVAGVAARIAGLLRGGAELLLGDPVVSRPTPPGEQATGPGSLFVICVLLLLVSTAALVAAYGTGSPLWERMFYKLAVVPEDVPRLGSAATSKGGLCAGMLVELVRSLLVILGMLLIATGWFFGQEALQLVPHAPWARLGPRRLGLRSAFRLVFLGLAGYLFVITLVHHGYHGPRNLWMCNGNPFLQEALDANDVATLAERQGKNPDDPSKMNREPPRWGEPGYDDYWWWCVLPYRCYYGYSFVMFVLAAPTVLTVCFYTVCSSLWNHLIAQPRQVAALPDDTKTEEIANRFRYYAGTYVEDIDRYLILLLMLLSCWAYNRWWDQNNLTRQASEHTTEFFIFSLGMWCLMFAGLLLAYPPLVQEAVKRFPSGAALDDFSRRHQPFRFFGQSVSRSSYFWLCLLVGAAGVLWYVRAGLAGWKQW
jgi:hypothetical protein